MKTILKTLLAVAMLAATGFSQEEMEERTPLLSTISIAPRVSLPENTTPPKWFGEKLEFEIKWGIITVGDATMHSDGVVDIDGTPCYYIKTTAHSTSFVDTFFKVRDKNESVINVADLSSVGFTKKIREGTYLWDEWVIFNNKNNSFMGQEKNKEGNISFVKGDIPGKVQDILSAIYYVRHQELKVGTKIVLDVNTRKNWPLTIKVLRREKVKTNAGEFDCFVVEPKLRDKGIFVQKGKSLQIWLTADEYHMPVMMKAEVFIGHVSARLEKFVRPFVRSVEKNVEIGTQ